MICVSGNKLVGTWKTVYPVRTTHLTYGSDGSFDYGVFNVATPADAVTFEILSESKFETNSKGSERPFGNTSPSCSGFLVKWASNIRDEMPLSTLFDFVDDGKADFPAFSSIATYDEVERLNDVIASLEASKKKWFAYSERREFTRKRNAILLRDPGFEKAETNELAVAMSEAEAQRRINGEIQSYKPAHRSEMALAVSIRKDFKSLNGYDFD